MQNPQELAAAFIERTRVPPGVREMFTEELTALLTAYGDDCAGEAEEQLKHTKAKLNRQAILIEQLEKARDFWRQKYNDAKGSGA